MFLVEDEQMSRSNLSPNGWQVIDQAEVLEREEYVALPSGDLFEGVAVEPLARTLLLIRMSAKIGGPYAREASHRIGSFQKLAGELPYPQYPQLQREALVDKVVSSMISSLGSEGI